MNVIIETSPNALNEVIDQFSARLDASGFPVVEADLESGTVEVDASSDPDEYSVLMAAVEAAEAVEVVPDVILTATFV